MYKVSPHQSHLFVKAARPRAFPIAGTNNNADLSSRRSASSQQQSVHRLDHPESPREAMTSPKLVFRKSPSKQNCQNGQPPHLSENHAEMLRFVQTSWQQLMQEYETAREQDNGKVAFYNNTVTDNNNVLSDFKPVDLEKWHVERMLTNMGIDPSITS